MNLNDIPEPSEENMKFVLRSLSEGEPTVGDRVIAHLIRQGKLLVGLVDTECLDLTKAEESAIKTFEEIG